MREDEQLTNLGGKAFKHAIRNVFELDDGNFILFAMTEDEQGKGELHRFAAESNSASLKHAHEFIAKQRPRFAAIAYKGFFKDEDGNTNAIFIDCYDRTQGCGVAMGHRFQPTTPEKPMSLIGEMQVVEEDIPYPTHQ